MHRYGMVAYTSEPALPQRTYFLPNFISSQAAMPVPMWCFCRVLRRSACHDGHAHFHFIGLNIGL
jgi:hypothetical protein